MKFTKEVPLEQFEFWAGAKTIVHYLTPSELQLIDDILEDLSYDGNLMSDADVNDLFWFENDTIAEWLGYKSFEDIIQERREID